MNAAIRAKLHSQVLVVTKSPADYFSLRFGLTNKGYRNFSIVYDAEAAAAELASRPADVILVSSEFDPAERRELLTRFGAGAARNVPIHLIELPRRKIRVPLAEAETPAIDTLAGRFGIEDIPINIELELTSRCNARCIFCPIDKMVRVNKAMEPDELRSVLDACKRLRPSLVYLCGVGEPLLFRGVVDVVRELSYEVGCPVGINTNGQLLTPEVYERLIEAGISLVNVSINGVSDETYGEHMKHCSLERVHANIERALEIKPETISLQGVITQKNQHEIPELVRYWTGRGVKIFTFNQCSNKSGFLDDHDKLWVGDLSGLYQEIADHRLDSWVSVNSCNFAVKQQNEFLCRVPMNFVSVDVRGNILHCMHDFSDVTAYGRFADYEPEALGELMMKRVSTKLEICQTCNAPKQDVNTVLWNGQVVTEKEMFTEVAPWEIALARAAAERPPGAPDALAAT